MSSQTLHMMTPAQKLCFLAGREQVFGWSRGDRGSNFNVHSAEFAQQAATQLIALGQRSGLISRDATPKEIALVQHCLDSRALKGRWTWVNSAEPSAEVQVSMSSVTQPFQAQPVEHLVDMARRHGAHGFRGDPRKESAVDDGSDVIALARSVGLSGFSTDSSNANNAASCHPDDRAAADVIGLARSVGLAGVRPDPARSSQQPAIGHYEHPDDRAAADVIALARSVGLAGFGKSEPTQSAANQNAVASTPGGTENSDDGADVLALARAVGLKGFAK